MPLLIVLRDVRKIFPHGHLPLARVPSIKRGHEEAPNLRYTPERYTSEGRQTSGKAQSCLPQPPWSRLIPSPLLASVHHPLVIGTDPGVTRLFLPHLLPPRKAPKLRPQHKDKLLHVPHPPLGLTSKFRQRGPQGRRRCSPSPPSPSPGGASVVTRDPGGRVSRHGTARHGTRS